MRKHGKSATLIFIYLFLAIFYLYLILNTFIKRTFVFVLVIILFSGCGLRMVEVILEEDLSGKSIVVVGVSNQPKYGKIPSHTEKCIDELNSLKQRAQDFARSRTARGDKVEIVDYRDNRTVGFEIIMDFKEPDQVFNNLSLLHEALTGKILKRTAFNFKVENKHEGKIREWITRTQFNTKGAENILSSDCGVSGTEYTITMPGEIVYYAPNSDSTNVLERSANTITWPITSSSISFNLFLAKSQKAISSDSSAISSKDSSLLVTFITVWLAITGGIYGLFNKAGEALKNKTKREVANWLKNVKIPDENFLWPNGFSELFDEVFTKKHFSFQCFLRSCAASIVSVIITVLFFIILGVELIPNADMPFMVDKETQSFFLIIVAFIIVIICISTLNIFPDYLSLLESRYVIKIMTRYSSVAVWIVLLLVDFVLTNLIFFTSGYLLLKLIFTSAGVNVDNVATQMEYEFSFWSFVNQFIPINSFFGIGEKSTIVSFLTVFLISTYFTSIWVWLFFFSGILIKVLSRFEPLLNFMRVKMDINKKPLEVMGFVIIVIIS
ncbi:MAG: hypothetical protein AAF731_04910, partial [Bacteroidota bacterium]